MHEMRMAQIVELSKIMTAQDMALHGSPFALQRPGLVASIAAQTTAESIRGLEQSVSIDELSDFYATNPYESNPLS
jgi:hypothetical protein